MRFLYEFFSDQIDYDKEGEFLFLPKGFKKFRYQVEAVVDAESKLKKHGGVFLSDVVGLGKTYVAAMLASRLQKKVLVFAPPHLTSYWEEILRDFHVPAKVLSSGKLRINQLSVGKFRDFQVVIVDEAHRFRSEETESYEKLHQICQGKQVILITATPYNNRPSDIKNQLLLFQNRYRSTIPGITNLEAFFKELERKMKTVDRKKDPQKYKELLKKIGAEIRENILKYVMVRRTRREVEKFFGKDLKLQGLSFPKVNPPKKIYYILNNRLNHLYNETIETIKNLSYARYKPALYLKTALKGNDPQLLSQRNLAGLMKTLLLKRLESSFEAFRKSLKRFWGSHEKVLKVYKKEGIIFMSKEVDVYQLLEEEENLDKVMELLEKENKKELKIYSKETLSPDFYQKLQSDTETLKTLYDEWEKISNDPKLKEFLTLLKGKDSVLKGAPKIIIFTEFSETAEYLGGKLREAFGNCVMVYSSKSKDSEREKIIENFDPNSPVREDDVRFLVTTDVLAEGINLHRSNVIVNYDIPWNPTKVLQRVGRINRVGTKFNEIFIYNFFPVGEAERELGLESAAIAKLQAFHNALGEDAKYLTEEEEINAYGLFQKINSVEEEEDSLLKYVEKLRALRDKNQKLFERIKKLPKKCRSGRLFRRNFLITLFRKGDLKKICLSYEDKQPKEVGFTEAVELLEVDSAESFERIPLESYYRLLERNKRMFKELLQGETASSRSTKGFSRAENRLKRELNALKNHPDLSQEEKKEVRRFLKLITSGKPAKGVLKELVKKLDKTKDVFKKVKILKSDLESYLQESRKADRRKEPAEVILSEYFVNK